VEKSFSGLYRKYIEHIHFDWPHYILKPVSSSLCTRKLAGGAMVNASRISIIFLSILLLSACGSVKVGRDFDVGVFAAKLERGVSLATDGTKYDEWDYYYAEGELADMSTAKVKILQIKFDDSGKVHGYNWSASRK
jgi:hypothetical protein